MNNKNRSVARNLGKPVNNNGTARAALIITALALVVFLFVGVAAKYISEREIGNNQVTPSSFYFTVDLLGDTNADAALGKEFHLYGGETKTITFNVQNFFDEKRITSSNITYKVEIDSSGTYESCSLDVDGTDLTLGSGTADSKPISLTIPTGYANEQTVVVKVQSTAPYTKEMTLTFVLHTYEAPAKYRIEDSEGSAVASLIIMTEEDIEQGNLSIDWSAISDLHVDTTNVYVLDEDLTLTTNQPNGDYLTKITVTKELKAGQSILIYFFKMDVTKNYSIDDTNISKENDGKFNIVLTAATAGGENG